MSSVAGRPAGLSAATAVTSGAPRRGTQARRADSRFCPPRPAMVEVISGHRDLSSELPPCWPGHLSWFWLSLGSRPQSGSFLF